MLNCLPLVMMNLGATSQLTPEPHYIVWLWWRLIITISIGLSHLHWLAQAILRTLSVKIVLSGRPRVICGDGLVETKVFWGRRKAGRRKWISRSVDCFGCQGRGWKAPTDWWRRSGRGSFEIFSCLTFLFSSRSEETDHFCLNSTWVVLAVSIRKTTDGPG